ncbi:esterase-like activity of phytase family protein [Cellulosimicrobium cellulans]|uniref:esterase-like activity of phytase family protein n=1 Tax=Cellulosimicrobium cellulans TaxID=1710 RepID=UPI001141BAA9|nr:esterase-like activity of phytase family protein [Cellulosimicrobium cellulans]
MRPTAVLKVAAALTVAVAVALTPSATALAAAPSGLTARPGEGAGPVRTTAVVPTLVARATLSADHLEEGPPSGALVTPANGRQGPFDGQVVPGFSAMIDNGDGTFWAQPDNGFGAKGNSADFLLRLYRVTPHWETARGGAGEIEVGEHLSLRDPDHLVDFPIVHEDTEERLLTGADFDIESVVRAKDGTFWIGEEFGPFLLHVDATGALLAPPVPFPDGKSPANPHLAPGETPLVGSSRGFEALAGSRDGRYLYPVLEGALVGDDPRDRVVRQFDTRAGRYTDRTWTYRVDTDANVVGDAFLVRGDELLLVERDDFDGAQSVTKRVYRVDLDEADRSGRLEKELVLDALKIANPHGLGAGDGYGTGDPFSLPVQSFETVVQLRDGRLLLANDNNYPGNDARVPGAPDDTEMVLVDLRRERVATDDVTVVGHRGASGYRPEHTLAAYEQAILQCADFIEPDVVSTQDGVLVARHENEIGGTTNVAQHPEFADRRTTKTIDGTAVTGWFTEDFTLAELRTLRAKERIPALRPQSTAFDGLYPVPTLAEVLDLARHSETCDGKQVGVYPETKHPTYFDAVGLSLEEPLVAALRDAGLDSREAPVIVQSFETGNLRELDRLTKVDLAQLVSSTGAPYDLVAAGDPRTYADLVTRTGLREIARYADGVGLEKNVMIPRRADGTLGTPTPVIRDAHRAGLEVHGWTFRAENQFLPAEYRSSADPAAYGDLAGEVRVFLDAGMDGFFTDQPDLGVAAVRDR